jgi:NADH:ubiquinone oxidoreductase subunit 2 (subunit N)
MIHLANISMRPEPYISFLPECILVFGLLLILLTDLIGYRKKTTFLSLIALASLLVAEAVLSSEPKGKSVTTFLDLFGLNDFGRIFQSLVVFSSIICVFLSIEYIERTGTSITELLLFLLMGTIGGMFLCNANDLVTIFVSLECLSLCSYLLCSYTKKDIRSNEAAIKYLLMGGLNSSILIYGFSWLYGLSGGQIDMKSIANSFSFHLNTSNSTGFFIALACITIGLAFKLSLVPFHQWTPDIYEGVRPVVQIIEIVHTMNFFYQL